MRKLLGFFFCENERGDFRGLRFFLRKKGSAEARFSRYSETELQLVNLMKLLIVLAAAVVKRLTCSESDVVATAN